jgi:hypothetical protein
MRDVVQDDDAGMKWKVYGRLVSGAPYAVVVRILDGDCIRVITIHPPP